MSRVIERIIGSKNQRDLRALTPFVGLINELEAKMISLHNDEFLATTKRLRQRIANGEQLDKLLAEAFALVREAARRRLGERMYDCQLMGGIVLHRGSIVEMKTGEGKTLSSVTAAYLNALSGNGVHIVTVNDYLAQRDANWMGRIFDLLGVSVGVIVADMNNSLRRDAYNCDVTYGTNNEFGFDYLRDNMQWDQLEKVQRRYNFCIVDEIDSILIDEARTPLIISGAADDDTSRFAQINALVDQLTEVAKNPETGDYPDEAEGFILEGDFKIDEKGKRVSFTEDGMATIEKILQTRKIISDSVFTDNNFEFIHYFSQALRAHRLFQRDVDYVMQDRKVEIVDEFTGRILHGRRYSDGLHQAIEAKEQIPIMERSRTLASITFQNYFKLYKKLSGMTGTADTEATEFDNIYGLDVVVIPTNRPVVRQDDDDVIFLNENDKLKAICNKITECYRHNQPVLVGTVSIEKSELLSSMLTKSGTRHEVLNAKNHAREATIIAQAGAPSSVTIATNMAGRGTDIKLGGNNELIENKKKKLRKTRSKIAVSVQWEGNYDKVKSAGGLYVIGTERHESRRIDNQLRGRSGRQGDPGHSQFYISMDDDLMRLFGGGVRNWLNKLRPSEDEPLTHPWLNKSLESAQHKVEERNFETRKHLLDFDNVLNEQRKFIYTRRDEIIAADNLIERIINSVAEEVEILVNDVSEEHSASGDWNTVLGSLKTHYFFVPEYSPSHYDKLPPSEFEKTVVGELRHTLESKAEHVGRESFNLFIRYEYLRSIDLRWQDHLESLNALQDAVRLRAYSQKNPLLEYKLEGFEIFDQMLEEIRQAITERIFKVTISHNDKHRSPASSSAIHLKKSNLTEQFSSIAPSATGTIGVKNNNGTAVAIDASRGSNHAPMKSSRKYLPFVSEDSQLEQKIGRNQPCPCGSGKKYKHCHGS